MISQDQLSFHEAEIVDFYKKDDLITLSLQGVLVGGAKRPVVMSVSSVVKVLVNGQPLAQSCSLMENDFGEILTLDYSKRALSALVEWHNFGKGTSETKDYEITGERVFMAVD